MKERKYNTISFIIDNFPGCRGSFWRSILLSLLIIVPLVASPIIVQIIVDNIFPGLNPEWVLPLKIITIFLIIYNFVVRLMTSGQWRDRVKMSTGASSRMVWHLIHLPMSFFSNRYAGEIVSRAALPSDISKTIITKVFFLAGKIVLAAVYLIMMFRYNVYLTGFALLYMAVNLITITAIRKRRKEVNRKMLVEDGRLEGYTATIVNNMEAIKGSNSEGGFFQLWSRYFADSQKAAIECTTQNAIIEILPMILNAICSAGILGLGAYLVIEGELTAGILISFQSISTECINPVSTIFKDINRLSEIATKCERMEEILSEECDVTESIDTDAIVEGGKLMGKIELKNITFGYDRNAEPLFKDFSMTLEPGKSVAFVGASGCGKSTLANLISGLYQPWSGEILFDGKQRSEIDRNIFTSSVAIINQAIALFDGDIEENIKLWDDSIEDFTMILAAHNAQIHYEIAARPGTYNAPVENGGANFSGGQRQRIEIASVLAKEPTILIMDEGTSALDAITEEKLMNALKQMGISLILIAHRLSTIRDCDEIIVLDHGKVLERGNHQALIQNGGMYSELMASN